MLCKSYRFLKKKSMKNLLLLFPFLLLFACQNASEKKEAVVEIKDVILKGMVENAKGGEATIVIDGKKISALLDETGNFMATIPVEIGQMAQLSYGGERTTFYVEPGDAMTVKFNVEEFDETMSYSGKGAEESNYLASKYLLDEKLMSDWRAVFGLEIAEFIAKMDDMKQQMMGNFKTALMNNSGMSPDFVKMEKQNILIANANNRLMYPEYFAYVAKTDEPEMAADYYDFLAKFEFNDDKMLASQDFKSFIEAYLSHQAKGIVGEDNDKFAVPNAQIQLIGEFSKNQKVKDYAYYSMMGGLLYQHGADIPENIMTAFQANCKDAESVEKVMKEYNQWTTVAKGKDAPTWKYENIKGEIVGLEDLRGKVVYIDVWATWCGPCMQELPYLEDLETKYAAGGKIEFVSVSIDKDKDAWEKMVVGKSMKGVQLYADKAWDSSICKDNLITGIPRFMLIDTEGKLINVNAPRPSSDEINTIFEEIQNRKPLLSQNKS
ncbi:MAG: thiol-disulfide isomerase/thioredoxin [Paraglaciecola sp.]|jgi:thiol-disulfide isomerase/thioredoxin